MNHLKANNHQHLLKMVKFLSAQLVSVTMTKLMARQCKRSMNEKWIFYQKGLLLKLNVINEQNDLKTLKTNTGFSITRQRICYNLKVRYRCFAWMLDVKIRYIHLNWNYYRISTFISFSCVNFVGEMIQVWISLSSMIIACFPFKTVIHRRKSSASKNNLLIHNSPCR